MPYFCLAVRRSGNSIDEFGAKAIGKSIECLLSLTSLEISFRYFTACLCEFLIGITKSKKKEQNILPKELKIYL